MGFLQRLAEARKAFIRASSPPTAVSARNYLAGIFGDLVEPPIDITPLGELERDNPTIHRIVMAIARDAASVKLVLVRKSKGVKRYEEAEDHPARKLFAAPNEVDPEFVFWETVYSDLLVFGNHYSWLELDGNVPVRALRIPADEMKIRPDNSGKRLIKEYVWEDKGGNRKTYPVESILQFKTKNLQNRLIGMSPLEPLRPSVLLERTMNKWNWNRFINSIPTNLILQSEQMVAGGEDRKEQLRRYIKQKMAGPEHAGEPLILDGERWKVDVISRPSEDEIAFLSGLKWIRATYAMNYGIPPSQLGDWSDSFRSNSKEQTADYVSEILGGWHRLVLAFLNDIYLKRYWPGEPDLEFQYDYSAVPALQPYRYQMAQINQILVQSAMVTPDEARQAMGYDESPEEAMQKFYWNGKELGEEPEPVVAPGVPGPGPGKDEDPEDEPKDPGPADNQQKSAKWRLLRAAADDEDEEYLLLDETSLIDEKDDKERGKRMFRPIIGFLVLGAAINWLRANKKKDDFNARTPAYNDWVDVQTIRIVNGVTDETLERVRNVIRASNSVGMSVREVKRGLAEVFKDRKSAFELERIARTETHQAAEGGGYLALIGDPESTHKRWVTSRDERVRGEQTGETRADHVGMDNQVVPKESRFRDPVSGALLRFPGDADGALSGADVINCRCTMVAETKDLIDRDAAWLSRSSFVTQSQRTVEDACRRFLVDMEARIVERLDAMRRRKAV